MFTDEERPRGQGPGKVTQRQGSAGLTGSSDAFAIHSAQALGRMNAGLEALLQTPENLEQALIQYRGSSNLDQNTVGYLSELQT